MTETMSAPPLVAAGARESAALEQFQTLHPSIQLYREAGRLNRVYGGEMEVGESPTDTAARFATAHAMMFGTPASDLVAASRSADGRHTQPLMFDQKTGVYKFTLVYYSQYRNDLPVFHSDLRLLVRNEPGYPLVLAASTIRNLGDFSADPIIANMEFDPASQTKTGMTRFSRPEKVIWAGIDGEATDPAVAVTFIGENDRTDAGYECWRFVCDARTGEVLYRETMIHFVDVNGTVKAMATPGAKANICTDEILFNYPWAKVDISGGSPVYADGNGNFTIPNAGSSSVTVRSYVDGLYFTIDNRAGAEETLSTAVTPPGPVNFVHNQADTDDMVLAQTNIYVAGNQCRDWILLQNPSFPGISTETGVLTVVNRTDVYCPCNAWSSSSDGSINFCQPGGGCPNTAWQSVLNHEYGHHCIDFSNSGQAEYGEGMADCISMLPVDDPNLGYGFFGNCSAGLRTADNTCQYSASSCSSCGSESHDCGQLLSGIVWGIRSQLVVTEPTDYLSILSSIVVNSILLHTGTGINQQIAIDLLTLDDNDGNINNGTPHRTEICAGFSAHGISCPALAVGMTVVPAGNLTSGGAAGGPFTPSSIVYTVQNLGPTSPISYTATKTAAWLTLTNASGSLITNQTAAVTVSINDDANLLPDGDYVDTVTFTNITTHVGDTTRTVTLRVGVNDNCANAKTVCPGQSYTGTTVGMTLDGSVSCDGASPGPDVWYKYTPATSGTATISLCSSGTTWDSVLSVHSGCPGTSTNQLNCSDDDCGGYGTHGTITRSVTGGTTYLIRIGGYASSNSGPFTLTIAGPACASADTTPPTPNPMTFAAAPAPAGTTSISMTATTANDATTPPVSYNFNCVTDSTDSGWQSSTTYIDTGLTANTSYTYRVKARDSATPTPNETSYSTPAASTATLIETPTGVSFGMVTNNSIMLNASGTLTNLTTGTSGLYFNSTTAGGNGGLNVWQQTTTDTATGLSPNTSYSFQVKARNQNSVETVYSAAAAKVTLASVPSAPTLSGATRTTLNLDVNANGNPAATEFAVMCTGSTPTDLNWNGKYVSAAGGTSATAVWRTEAQWAVTTVAGLQSCTTYTFAAKARNSDLAETAFSPGASSATAGHLGDMDGDGNVDGADIQAFVTCAVSGGSGCVCASESISAFVDCLLNVATCP
jgi:hypothetical protein